MYSVGQSIGSYTIIRPLGSGRTVDVYEAQHTDLQRRVALKVLQSRYLLSEENVSRFIAEYRAVNCLLHPAVVETYECGRFPDGSTFAATEFLSGETLAERLQRDLPFHEGLRIARQVASLLTMAHACGVLHRDLRPENIVLGSSSGSAAASIRVVDFGIARLAEEQGSRAGSVEDTAQSRYSAPERQRRTQPLGPKADVYAFGALLQDLLQSPSTSDPSQPAGADAAAVPATAERGANPAAQATAQDESARLIAGMLASQPSERPPMAEVRHTLERIWRTHKDSATVGDPSAQRAEQADNGRLSAPASEEASEEATRPAAQRLGDDDTADDDEADAATGVTAERPSDEAVPSRAPTAPPPRLAIAFAVLGLGMGLLAAGIAYRRSQSEEQNRQAADTTLQQPVVASLLTVVVDPVPAPATPPPDAGPPAGMIAIPAPASATGGGAAPTLWVDKADVDNAAFAAWLNTIDVAVRKERFVYLAERRVLDLRSKGSGLRWLKGPPGLPTAGAAVPAGRSGGRFVARVGKEAGATRYVDPALAQAFCAARDAQLPTPEQVTWLLRRGEATAAVWGAPLSLTAAHGFRCIRPAGSAL